MRRLLQLSLGLLLLVATVSTLRAQHCAYDGSAAIVVEPRDAATGRVISGLRVTLLDSLGVPVSDEEESYLFRDGTSGVIPLEGTTWARWVYENLWFGRGAYILVFGRYYEQFQVRIEDVDRRSDGVFYDPVTLRVAKEDIHPLCTGVNDWDRGERGRFAQKFHPIAVTLARRDVQ